MACASSCCVRRTKAWLGIVVAAAAANMSEQSIGSIAVVVTALAMDEFNVVEATVEKCDVGGRYRSEQSFGSNAMVMRPGTGTFAKVAKEGGLAGVLVLRE